jgi:hypothetical protein
MYAGREEAPRRQLRYFNLDIVRFDAHQTIGKGARRARAED